MKKKMFIYFFYKMRKVQDKDLHQFLTEKK
jgi:hypothetical protein